MIEISLGCKCGCHFTTLYSPRNWDNLKMNQAANEFCRIHNGEGHKLCSWEEAVEIMYRKRWDNNDD